MTTLRRLCRRLTALFRRDTYDDPLFTQRMQAARRYGVEQKRASLHNQRHLQQQRANRVELAYLHPREVMDD